MGLKDDDNMLLWKELQNKESFYSLCERPEPSTGNWGVTLSWVGSVCVLSRGLYNIQQHKARTVGVDIRKWGLSKLVREGNAFGYTLE